MVTSAGGNSTAGGAKGPFSPYAFDAHPGAMESIAVAQQVLLTSDAVSALPAVPWGDLAGLTHDTRRPSDLQGEGDAHG